MSLLTQFYPGPGGGGGLNGGKFAGGIYPGSLPMVIGWEAIPGAGALIGLPSALGVADSAWTNSAGYTLGYYYVSTLGGGIPVYLSQNVNSTMLFYGVGSSSFVNFLWQQTNSTLAINEASAGTDLNTISGPNFSIQGATTTMAVTLGGLVSWEGGAIRIVNGATVNFTTPAFTNIETCSFAFQGTGVNLSITNANLSIASVEKIIFDALGSENIWGGGVGGNINLSGGTSAQASTLSPAAQAAVTTLNASGWVITLNP